MFDVGMQDAPTPPPPPAETEVADPPAASPTKAPAKTKPRPKRPHRRVDQLPPWKVLLHNDDVNEMWYVTETITSLTPLGLGEAFERMMEAHRRGLSLLLRTHRERAELYRDQFRSKRLTVTIEPDH